jgi:NAD(P)-dependent dehydrogenase (short-subunit alcohol dehydrogenase family)
MGQTHTVPNLVGKTCIVTGASSGLGLATAKRLAQANANVICAVRNAEKGKTTVETIKTAYPDANVEFIKLDHESFQSVRDFVTQFQKKHSKLDILVNNAALTRQKFEQSVDGYEKTFQVNYMSAYLLTNLLVEQMLESVTDKTESGAARIVNVTSRGSKFIEDSSLILDDEKWNSSGHYEQANAYLCSKLALGLYTSQLEKFLREYRNNTGFLSVNQIDPGGFKSSLHRDDPVRKKMAERLAMLRVLASADKAAEHVVYVATSEETKEATGEHFKKSRGLPLQIKLKNQDRVAEALWYKTKEWTRPKEGPKLHK